MNDSQSDQAFTRGHVLTTQLLEFGLSDQESRELEGLLRENSELLDWYAEHIALHGMLRYTHLEPLRAHDLEDLTSLEPVARAEMSKKPDSRERSGEGEKIRVPILEFLGECFQQGGSFLYKSNVFTVLIAIGLPGLILVLLALSLSSQTPSQDLMATVTRTHHCTASLYDKGNLLPVSEGTRLCQGQQILLQKGLLEIKFVEGARTILEAPATFHIRDGNAGFLKEGRLTANVPPAASGFTIETPLINVVDLGTDFGLSVDENETVETHVFKGEIALATVPTKKNPATTLKHLTVDQAARVSSAPSGKRPKIETMDATAEKFVRSIPTPNSRVDILNAGFESVSDGKADHWTKYERPGTLDYIYYQDSHTKRDLRTPGATSVYAHLKAKSGCYLQQAFRSANGGDFKIDATTFGKYTVDFEFGYRRDEFTQGDITLRFSLWDLDKDIELGGADFLIPDPGSTMNPNPPLKPASLTIAYNRDTATKGNQIALRITQISPNMPDARSRATAMLDNITVTAEKSREQAKGGGGK